jgi:hypothetical protein
MVAQLDRDYVALGIGRAVRRLISYACFEGRPATTRGRWTNPAVFALLRALAALPGERAPDRPVFITGLGRSGTTILGMLLSVHRDVGFLNEPKAMWHVIDPRQDINGNYGGASPVYRLTERDADSGARARARRLMTRYLAAVRAPRVVDKYPELIFRIGYVRALFPDARFIFIHRNGVDACRSIVHWSRRLGREAGGVVEDWWGRDDCKWHTLWSQLVAGDPQYAEIAALGPETLDHANRAALEWVVTMREGLRQAAQHGDVMTKVRYEDLLTAPESTLNDLLRTCGLPPDPDVIRYAKGRLSEPPGSPEVAELLPPVRRCFDQTMAEFGYAT